MYSTKRLGDVLKFKNGKSIKPGTEGAFPAYGSNGLIGGSPEFQEEDAIILGRVGAYCGSVAYCPGKFWASDNTIVAYPRDSSFNIRFISYLLHDLNLNLWAGGAAQPLLTQTVLKQVEAPVPDITEQQKIATILSAYDDLIGNNLRRIKILEEIAQNLYREWFVKFRFPGYEQVQMVDSVLGKIPEGWEAKRLDQLVAFKNEGTKAGEHLCNRIYLPIDCVPRKSLAVVEVRQWVEAQSSLHLFEEGDIIFGAMRPYFHKVVVAPFKGVTRKTCFVLRSWKPTYHAFSALTLFQESTVSFANTHSKGATIPYAVWPQAMDGMLVIVPPEELAKQFETIVGPMISAIANTYFRNKKLRQTRDLLLPKLISGELDVSELDINIREAA